MIRTLLELNGDRVLRSRLRSLPKRSQGRVLRPALRAGAKVVLSAAKQSAPSDTGALKRSLVVRAAKGRKRGQVAYSVYTSAKTLKKKRGEGSTFYGAFQELGFKLGRRLRQSSRFAGSLRVNRGGSGGEQRVPGKRYLRNAVQSARSAALNAIRTVMRAKLDEEARRGI